MQESLLQKLERLCNEAGFGAVDRNRVCLTWDNIKNPIVSPEMVVEIVKKDRRDVHLH